VRLDPVGRGAGTEFPFLYLKQHSGTKVAAAAAIYDTRQQSHSREVDKKSMHKCRREAAVRAAGKEPRQDKTHDDNRISANGALPPTDMPILIPVHRMS
jgi:hypothetical protein